MRLSNFNGARMNRRQRRAISQPVKDNVFRVRQDIAAEYCIVLVIRTVLSPAITQAEEPGKSTRVIGSNCPISLRGSRFQS